MKYRGYLTKKKADKKIREIVKCAECGGEIDLKQWKLRTIFASFIINCPHCHKEVLIEPKSVVKR